MKTILFGLLQVVVSSGILYGYYHFFLRNKQFHQYNRFYLLGTLVISLLIPFLQIPVYFTDNQDNSSVVLNTLQTISDAQWEQPVVVSGVAPAQWNWMQLTWMFYAFIALLLLTRTLVSLNKIRILVKQNRVEKLDGIHFINTNEPGTPFSFFRWLFWHRKIDLNSAKGEQIFRHEIYHIEQKHSWDVLFTEFLTMICWINPFFHIIKKEIKAIHEFLADHFAVDEKEKWNYAELLLMQALETKHSLVNPFFHNQIKRRIAMITNSKKTSHRYLRKLLVLPVAALVLTLFAFKYKKAVDENAPTWGAPMTLIMEAGHADSEAGAVSPDAKYNEADISLRLVQEINRLAPEYNINTMMLRRDAHHQFETDKENPEYPDVFLSIHVNTTLSKTYQQEQSGFQAFISGTRQDKSGLQYASAILQNLSPVYKTDMAIRQRQNQVVNVLDKNSAPSVLLQCGYINNKADMAFISDYTNLEKVARKILEALRNVKNAQDGKENTRIDDVVQAFPDTSKPGIQIREVRADSSIKITGRPTMLTLRGVRDSSGKQPLYVVDGVIIEPSTRSAIVETLKPESIESITVLKDASTQKYGAQGVNGVIEITTKPEIREVSIQKLEGIRIEEKEIPRINEQVKDLNEVVIVGYAKYPPSEKSVFTKAEVDPSFPGGSPAWSKYLERNLNGNIPIDNKAPVGHYNVMVQFIVSADGSLSDIRALTAHGYGMEAEAIRVIKNGPSWIPAKQNGKAVDAFRRQPVTFVIISEADKKETITVVGYPTKKANTLKLSEPQNKSEEVTVVGFATKKPTTPLKLSDSQNKTEEVTVVGYPSKTKAGQQLTLSEPAQKKTEEVTVAGFSSKKSLQGTENAPLIYPNPSNNQAKMIVNSENGGQGSMQILDVNGRIVNTNSVSLSKGKNTVTVNTGDLSQGTYFVRVSETASETNGEKKVSTVKLVKE